VSPHNERSGRRNSETKIHEENLIEPSKNRTKAPINPLKQLRLPPCCMKGKKAHQDEDKEEKKKQHQVPRELRKELEDNPS